MDEILWALEQVRVGHPSSVNVRSKDTIYKCMRGPSLGKMEGNWGYECMKFQKGNKLCLHMIWCN